MKIVIIAAMTPSGVIGRTSKPCSDPWCSLGDCEVCNSTGRIPCNDLPWGRAYPEIDSRFDALTMGHAVVMGRREYEGDVRFPKWKIDPFDSDVAVWWTGPLGPDMRWRQAFTCVSREPCSTNADLTFTRWVRR